MHTSDFDFQFPEELIAYYPIPRGKARLLVVDKNLKTEPVLSIAENLPQYFKKGDALVLNDTKVLRARLVGKTVTGSTIESLLLCPVNDFEKIDNPLNYPPESIFWQAMVKPAKRFKLGMKATFSPTLVAKVMAVLEDGTRILKFDMSKPEFYSELEKVGKIPLPPYIKREANEADLTTYQSVFAEKEGSVAAPTASLHFSDAILAAIGNLGVEILKVTLHVGAGTFKPVKTESILDHDMHSEYFELSTQTAKALNNIKQKGGKIWAVGTTAARVLETQAKGNSEELFVSGFGQTNIFIYPGYTWKGVDCLLTNFHWPKSTLFMLVCSLLGIERAKELYQFAIENKFRLFSYGDAMLIR